MTVSIKLTDEFVKKLDEINEVFTKQSKSFISFKLPYKKIVEGLINEAYRQLVLGENNEDKSHKRNNRRMEEK